MFPYRILGCLRRQVLGCSCKQVLGCSCIRVLGCSRRQVLGCSCAASGEFGKLGSCIPHRLASLESLVDETPPSIPHFRVLVDNSSFTHPYLFPPVVVGSRLLSFPPTTETPLDPSLCGISDNATLLAQTKLIFEHSRQGFQSGALGFGSL